MGAMLQPEVSSLVCTLCEWLGVHCRALMTSKYSVIAPAAHSLSSLYIPAIVIDTPSHGEMHAISSTLLGRTANHLEQIAASKCA